MTTPGRVISMGGKLKYVYMPAGFEEILEGHLYTAKKGGVYCLPENGDQWLYVGSLSTASASVISPVISRMTITSREWLYNELTNMARKAA